MTAGKIYRAVGLMSGTVLDGEIDVALIETDGHQLVRALDFYTHPYAGDVRDKVRACFGKRTPDAATATAEKLVTDLHIDAVLSSGYNAEIIGFHGQTITHAPADQFTWQLGDSARLARETGIDVVGDLRQADIQAGGQGAPLLPLYHAARLADHPRPVAILNLGGVANITFIDDEQIIAFDTGPANALMDDYMRIHYRQSFDNHGAIAAQGTVQQDILRTFLQDPFLAQTGPKSLDRNHWDLSSVDSLAPEDAMATLLALSTGSISAAMARFSPAPRAVFAGGGGRKNRAMMRALNREFARQIAAAPRLDTVEALGWNGDALEAEGFAYLAVRSLLNEPLTLPSTTGVPAPQTGGQLYRCQ